MDYYIEHDPWENESIEYDLSGDEAEATRALDSEFDITVVIEILERKGIRIDSYTLEYDRHIGSKWSILAHGTPEQFDLFRKSKHPYVTMRKGETPYMEQ